MPASRPRLLLELMEMSPRLLDRLHDRLGPTVRQTTSQRRGLLGERAAYFHVRRQGYTVVARRWRHALLDGEVDLIAWDGEVLCFIEVKSRSSTTPFAAELSVDRHKADTLKRMADAYIRQLPWPQEHVPSVERRFDVVTVYFSATGAVKTDLLRDYFR